MSTLPSQAHALEAIADSGDPKRVLRARFPEWSIIQSDKGRWWATRVPPRDDMSHISDVDADTPAELYLRLLKISVDL